MSEPKYKLYVSGGHQDVLITDFCKFVWTYDDATDVYASAAHDTWDAAMARAVELRLGRLTSEAGTFELDPGVEIKAVKE